MSFLQDVNKWLVKVDYRYNQAFQNICYDASMGIAEKTPCSSGKLLGRWEPSQSGPQFNAWEGGESAWQVGPGGWFKDESIASANRQMAMSYLEPKIKATTEQLEGGDTYYFSNNTEYGKVAEYEGWVPYGGKQAPYRMVGRTEEEFEAIVFEAVKRAKQVI